MAINLEKGQKIDLTKGNPNLKKLKIGMGWASSSFGSNIDLDTSVLMFKDGAIKETIYFGNKRSKDGSIFHHGDDLTGGGRAEDPNEIVDIILEKVSPQFEKLGFIMNIFNCSERRQNFGKLKDAWIGLYNADTNEQLAKFSLSGNSDIKDKTALIIGEVYRHNGEWKFNSLGRATYDKTIGEVSRNWNAPVTNNASANNNNASANNDGLLGRIGRFFS